VQGKITKASVDALAHGEFLADTEVKGFVVRRLPSGVVTYGLRYRAGGKQRWLALGIHGPHHTCYRQADRGDGRRPHLGAIDAGQRIDVSDGSPDARRIPKAHPGRLGVE